MIDGNRLVEALSLPSHDKRVLELLKELGLKRPVKDENYDGVSILEELNNEKGYFTFDEKCETKKQKDKAYGAVDFYLNGITIQSSDFISPPFGIGWSDSYEEVKAILGRKADFTNKYKHKIWILDDDEKKYLLNIAFTQNGVSIRKWGVSPYDDDFQYKMLVNKD